MSSIIIPDPTEKKWTQPNVGELFGHLFSTFNMDLRTERGKIKLSTRMSIITSDDDDAQLLYPTACLRTKASNTDQWWVLCHTVLFKTSGTSPVTSYTQDAISTGDGTPTDLNHLYSDMENFNGNLIVSNSDNLHKLSGGSWTQDWWDGAGELNQTNLTALIYHPVKKGFNNLLLIGDDKWVHTIDVNDNVSYKRLTFPVGYRVVWIISGSDRYWIGLRHIYSSEGAVAEWDGSAENFNRIYGIEDKNCLAGVIKNNNPVVINGKGQLMGFTGNGFEEIARLPVANGRRLHNPGALATAGMWQGPNGDGIADRMVHPNGMALIGEEIHILITGAIVGQDAYILENMPAGIWCYDKELGLYHRYSLSQYKSGSLTDFGTRIINVPGFLTPTFDGNLFIAGASIYTDNFITVRKAIFKINVNVNNGQRGNFVTSRIPANNIENMWQKVWLKFRQLSNSDDRIVIKYKVSKNENFYFWADITWTDTDTFTSTSALFANVIVGDEIEITIGKGAGALAHVDSINEAGGTYTVNLTETIPGVAGGASVKVDRWTLLDTISDVNITNKEVGVGVTGQWIQFKVELRGNIGTADKTPEIDEIEIVFAPQVKAE